MGKVLTSKGTWTVYGINFIPSDSIYSVIKDAVENDKLDQKYLQQKSGHRAPIVIDRENKTIDFHRC